MFKFLSNAISNALGFSRVEARGTLLLIFIMLLSIVLTRIYVSFIKNLTQHDYTETDALKKWVAEVESSYQRKSIDDPYDKSIYLPTKKKAKASYTKSSNITSSTRNPNEIEIVKVKEPITIADINTASAEDLQKVKGIGPSFSKRIIKFRNKLGGFASNDQLQEVYGLDDETIVELQKHFSVLSRPQPLDINSDSAKVLSYHPYISYDLAWIIINYRKQHGDIKSIDDFKKIKALDEETFAQLEPYLK